MGSSDRVPRVRGDLNQVLRYLKSADEILARAGVRTYMLRREVEATIKRLTADDLSIAGLAGNIGTLRNLSKKMRDAGEHDAATEVSKAVAVLRDTTH